MIRRQFIKLLTASALSTLKSSPAKTAPDKKRGSDESLKKAVNKKRKDAVGQILDKCNKVYGAEHEKTACKVADEWVDQGLYKHPQTKEEATGFMMKAYEEVIQSKKACALDEHDLFGVQE